MSIASLYPSINPSLLLDFANSKVLDSRVTFTRTTTATYYDGVTTAKAEENLFTYSQNSTTNWTNFSSRLTITTSYEAAPDGTTTGMRLVNSSGSTGYFYQNVGSNILVSGTTYTLSVYVKSNTGSSQTISLMIPDTGTTTNVTATTTWSRVSWTPTLASTNSFAGLVLSNGADISVWGFQLEQRSSATAYTATTTQAITNYIPVLQTASAGQARFDHNPTTGESLGLLIEEARTNSLTYSAQFDNAAWTKGNATITADTIVAPDGTLTGDKLVENTSTSSHNVTQNYTQTATLTASIYAKPGGRSSFVFNGGNQSGVAATFNVSTGAISSVGGSVTATAITPVGNGWYRCSMTWSNTSTVGLGIFLESGGSTSYTGDGFSGLFLWGAQIEAGSFATSYIPTVASSVTRNADAASMTGTNFSSWFNYGAMTIYYEATGYYTASGAYEVFDLDSGSNSGRIRTRFLSSEQASQLDASSNSTFSLDGGTVTANSFAKVAVGLTQNSQALSLNGGTVVTATAPFTTLPVPTTARIGTNWVPSEFLNGTIKKIAFYPVKVTNAQLQALTV